MQNNPLRLASVDHKKDQVIIEFSNGRVGMYSVGFLWNHLGVSGTEEVPNPNHYPAGRQP